MSNDGATWLASYPKSGNTWLRCLLEAYRRGGLLDINDICISASDGDANFIRMVSPIPVEALQFRGQLMLRPAALMWLVSRLHPPRYVKTHFANISASRLTPCIPRELTSKAIYVVRDPRSVVLSVSHYYNFPTEHAVQAMNNLEFNIGGDKNYSLSFVSSWSNHVRSWVGEKEFPVHVVRYEDLVSDGAKELTEVLQFLEIEPDEDLVERAVKAADLSRLRNQEAEGDGFRENAARERYDHPSFFGNGGNRWRDELSPKHTRQIEEDHGEVMQLLGYELTTKEDVECSEPMDSPKLTAVPKQKQSV